MRKAAYKGHNRCTRQGCHRGGRREATSIASSFKKQYVQSIMEYTAYRAMPHRNGTVRHNAIMSHGHDVTRSSNNETEHDVKVIRPNNQRRARIVGDELDEQNFHPEEQCSGV